MDDTGQPTLQPTDSVQQHVSVALFTCLQSDCFNISLTLRFLWCSRLILEVMVFYLIKIC